jgi:hypothetical protein
MSENRLPDYLDHMQQAATDACGFVEGQLLVVLGDANREKWAKQC